MMNPDPASLPQMKEIVSRFLESFPHVNQFLTVKEVAGILDLSANTVRGAYDVGKLYGFSFSGKAAKGEEQRFARRIARDSVLYFVVTSATFDAPMLITLWSEAAMSFHPDTIQALRVELTKIEAAKRKARA